MDTIIPLLFGLLSIFGFLVTSALLYLIVKPAPERKWSPTQKSPHLPARKLLAP